MRQFKIGDRVRFLGSNAAMEEDPPVGGLGTVTHCDLPLSEDPTFVVGDIPYLVMWDNGERMWYGSEEIELVTETPKPAYTLLIRADNEAAVEEHGMDLIGDYTEAGLSEVLETAVEMWYSAPRVRVTDMVWGEVKEGLLLNVIESMTKNLRNGNELKVVPL